MRVVKPLVQSLLHRKFDHDKKSFLSIVSIVFFDFKSQKLCSEQDLYKFYGETCIPVFNAEVIDLCGRKKQPELVVNGYAYGRYAQNGRTAVQVRLNNVNKTLSVWGDRYWNNGKPSKPQDFEEIAISWKNAYGGEGFAQNPHGKGRNYVQLENGSSIKFLPNIEDPKKPIQHENEEYSAAGFGSLAIDYPERNLLMGTYDERWREEEFPSLAKDFDWAYFNQAPQDQRLSHLSPGDVAVFTGMHPELAECRMVIPELKAKAFLQLAKDQELNDGFLQEVELNLSTLWAFPHLEKGFLISEGVVEVERWFFVDDIVTTLMGALEHTERPRAISYYEEVFRLRTNPQLGAHYADVDRQLVDEEFLGAKDRAVVGPALKNKLNKLLKDLKELEQKQIEHKAQYAHVSLNDLPSESIEIMQTDIADVLSKQFGEQIRSLEDLERLIDEGFDLEQQSMRLLEQEQQEKSFLQRAREHKQEMQQAKQSQSHLSKKEVKQAKRDIKNLAARYAIEESDVLTQELKFKGLDGQFMSDKESPHYQHYHQMQQAKEEFLRNEQENSEKRLLLLLSKNKESSKGLMEIDSLSFYQQEIDDVEDIEFFLLRNKQINQQSYQEHFIYDACISHCHFIQCDFSKAELSSIEFVNCTFESCRFVSTNITKSVFDSCTFEDCHLIGLELEKSTLVDNYFKKCRFNLSNIMLSSLYRQRFSACSLEQVTFMRNRLIDLFFDSCEMKQLSFTRGKLKGLSFEKCTIESAAFVIEALIEQMRFNHCQLSKMFFKTHSRFQDLEINDTSDRESSWRELNINNILIKNSFIENCDFSKTHLLEGEIKESSFRESLWMASILERITLHKISFAEAILMGLISKDSYFKKVNFFSAELSYIDIDSATVFDVCSMERANTVPSLRSI